MRDEKRYYVYIMASRSLTLYTGVTGDILHRALQHKAGEMEGFTKKYQINRLVYYEVFKYVNNAIAREKQIKAWTRVKRLDLIKSENPTWQDLAEGWGEPTKLQIPHFVRDDKGLKVVDTFESADVSRENPDNNKRSENSKKKESVGDQDRESNLASPGRRLGRSNKTADPSLRSG
jgi:putative endonuclease